ncbi:unknown [Bacteroides sp. CAG:875]|nr:unknown [Bacteroides sp. CAG:875]
MCKHPLNTRIIEPCQPFVLQQVLKVGGKPVVLPDARTVEQHIQHGQQHDAREIRHHQSRRDGKRLVHEDGPGYPAHEHQRHEHRDGGERRAQHRRDHLRGSRHGRTLQRIPLLTVLRHVLRHDDGIVNHHAHRQDQSRKRDHVERDPAEVEKEERDHHRGNHGDANDQRRTHVADEEHRHDEDEQEAQREVLLQVRYGIVQQLRLVPADAELYVGIYPCEIVRGLLQLTAQVVHVLLALLDDGQRHRPLSSCQRAPRLVAGNRLHVADVPQLPHLSVAVEPDLPHVLRRTENRGDADVVFIIPVAHQHAPRLHVIRREDGLQVGNAHAQALHPAHIRHDAQHLLRHPRHVGHGHLRQLFDAPLHHVLRQRAHLQEGILVRFPVRHILLQRHVQVEHRDVRRARLDGLRPCRIPGQAVHGRVNLLVHLDEGQVGIRAEIERQADDARTVARLAPHLAEPRHLHELPSQWSHHRVLQLAGRRVLPAHLHGDLRNVYVRKQRYGQREVSHQPHDEAGGESHEYRYRSFYQKSYHSTDMF